MSLDGPHLIHRLGFLSKPGVMPIKNPPRSNRSVPTVTLCGIFEYRIDISEECAPNTPASFRLSCAFKYFHGHGVATATQ